MLMKRNNTEQVGDVIRQLLRQQGLETPLNEYRLVEAWKDVVGPTITKSGVVDGMPAPDS